MTGLDLSAILPAAGIAAGVVVGLTGRRALRAWDEHRDENPRDARQRSTPKLHLPSGAHR